MRRTGTLPVSPTNVRLKDGHANWGGERWERGREGEKEMAREEKGMRRKE